MSRNDDNQSSDTSRYEGNLDIRQNLINSLKEEITKQTKQVKQDSRPNQSTDEFVESDNEKIMHKINNYNQQKGEFININQNYLIDAGKDGIGSTETVHFHKNTSNIDDDSIIIPSEKSTSNNNIKCDAGYCSQKVYNRTEEDIDDIYQARHRTEAIEKPRMYNENSNSKEIKVHFIFANGEDELPFYDIYSLITYLPKLCKVAKALKTSIIEIPLPKEITSSDLLEFLFLCKNGFGNDFTLQSFKTVVLAEFFDNEGILSKVVIEDIIPKLSKHNAFKYLIFSYTKLNERGGEESHIISILFTLLFSTMDLVSQNFTFYFENPVYTPYLMQLNKKLVEELIEKFLAHLGKNNFLLDTDAQRISTSINYSIVLRESLIALIRFSIMYKEDEIETHKKNLIDPNISDSFDVGTNSIDTDKKLNRDCVYRRLLDYLVNNYQPKESILISFIQEHLFLLSEDSLSEVSNLVRPTFTLNLDKSLENLYMESPLLINNNKVILVMIVYYKRLDDILEVSIKSQNNCFEENELTPNFFKSLTYLFALSISDQPELNQTKMVNLLVNQTQKIFFINQFKKKVKGNLSSVSDDSFFGVIKIRLNMKICYYHSLLIAIMINEFKYFSEDPELQKVPKDIFLNIIKQSAVDGVDHQRLVIGINNWLSDPINMHEDLTEIFDYLNFSSADLHLIIELIMKSNHFLMENPNILSVVISKLQLKLQQPKEEKIAIDELILSIISKFIIIKNYIEASSKIIKNKPRRLYGNNECENLSQVTPSDIKQKNLLGICKVSLRPPEEMSISSIIQGSMDKCKNNSQKSNKGSDEIKAMQVPPIKIADQVMLHKLEEGNRNSPPKEDYIYPLENKSCNYDNYQGLKTLNRKNGKIVEQKVEDEFEEQKHAPAAIVKTSIGKEAKKIARIMKPIGISQGNMDDINPLKVGVINSKPNHHNNTINHHTAYMTYDYNNETNSKTRNTNYNEEELFQAKCTEKYQSSKNANSTISQDKIRTRNCSSITNNMTINYHFGNTYKAGCKASKERSSKEKEESSMPSSTIANVEDLKGKSNITNSFAINEKQIIEKKFDKKMTGCSSTINFKKSNYSSSGSNKVYSSGSKYTSSYLFSTPNSTQLNCEIKKDVERQLAEQTVMLTQTLINKRDAKPSIKSSLNNKQTNKISNIISSGYKPVIGAGNINIGSRDLKKALNTQSNSLAKLKQDANRGECQLTQHMYK